MKNTIERLVISLAIAVFLYLAVFRPNNVFGQMADLMKPTQIQHGKVYGSPVTWQSVSIVTVPKAVTKDFVFEVQDMAPNTTETMRMVSIELLKDGRFMVYWPRNEQETAMMRVDANFDLLGKVIHTILYGDPEVFIKPKALESQD